MQREGLSTIFPCLFCNHEKSVAVKLDKKQGVGVLSCKVCNQNFQSSINCSWPHPLLEWKRISANPRDLDLSAAVDVYSDWVDACDQVAKDHGAEKGGDYAPSRAAASDGRPGASRARDEEDDDNDIIDDEDEDGAGGYGADGIAADDEY